MSLGAGPLSEVTVIRFNTLERTEQSAEAADPGGPEVMTHVCEDLVERCGADFAFVVHGTFGGALNIHRAVNPNRRDAEQQLVAQVVRGVKFLDRLLQYADGDQLPEGLRELIRSILQQTNGVQS